MSKHRRLLQCLTQELCYQERLLELLTRERAAIAKLNQEQISSLTVEKNSLFDSMKSAETQRSEALQSLTNGSNKFREALVTCNDEQLRAELEKAANEVRRTAESVKELNTHNGQLLRHAMGIVASTISIFRNAAQADSLPVYGNSGKLKTEEPALPRAATPVSREA